MKSSAQIINKGVIKIKDNYSFSIKDDNFEFGDLSQVSTTRTDLNHGKFTFRNNATWSDFSSNKYVDGYVEYIGALPFVYPVGQNGNLAFIKTIPISYADFNVAYVQSNPNIISSNLDSSVSTISSEEYWVISSVSVSRLSLSWNNSSNISNITSSDLSNLTIIGFDGVKWIQIPSTVDAVSFLGNASSFNSGSISSSYDIAMSNYLFFSLGSKGQCSPLVLGSGITKTWDGSWTPSTPSILDDVVINAPYFGSLSCSSLLLNSNITLADNEFVEIINGASGIGKIIMSSSSSLVQRNSISPAPNIELTKTTRPMRRYDYVFISSPINNGNSFYSDLINSNNVAVNGNFGQQTNSAFSNFKTLDATGSTQIIATNAEVGKGLRALVRNQAPFNSSNITGAWNSQKYPIHIKTIGVANNGDVPIVVPSNSWAFE